MTPRLTCALIIGCALAAPALAAMPTVPAVQDWAGDSIATGCRALGFPRPVADRLIARVQRAIADGAEAGREGYQRLGTLAAEPPPADADAQAAGVFTAVRTVIDVRDAAKRETYAMLPPRNRARALVYVEEQSTRQRRGGPAGMEGGLAYLERDGGRNLTALTGADAARRAELLPRVRAFAAARRALRERREALFVKLGRAVQTVAPEPAIAALLTEWQDIETVTTALDRSQLAEVEATLTPAERRQAARELVPMIDRGMRWAGLYFKLRGTFNRRDVRSR